MKIMKVSSNLSICLLLAILYLTSSKEMSKDMQCDNLSDLNADYTYIEIDKTDSNFGFSVERNIIAIEPYALKMIYTPLQKFHIIRMSDIVIFNNFEIIYDINILTKNIFGLTDTPRFTKVQSVLNKLKLRYDQYSENCRFIFSNNLLNTPNLNIETTSVNIFTQFDNMNPYLSLVMNVFCFSTIDKAIRFNSYLMNMFNNFVGSTQANHLIYFNKLKMNNLKIIFRTSRMDQFSERTGLDLSGRGINQMNVHNNLSNLNIKYAYLNFSKNGLLFVDGPSNNVNNNSILHSFNYDNIRDCNVQMIRNDLVLPRDMLGATNKCCLKMRIDVKEVFDTMLNICSFRTSIYQCNLEAKFIQENLGNKCSEKLLSNIEYSFDNNFSMKEFIISK